MLRSLPLPDDVPGRIWLSAMPGRFEPLAGFLRAAEDVGATQIVCLAPAEEIAAKSPDYARAIALELLPLSMVHHPIPDYGLPQDLVAFAHLVEGLSVTLRNGQRLIVHCAAGIGRSGIVAQHLLMALGAHPESARTQVQTAGSGPETHLQHQFCNHPLGLPGHIPTSFG